MNFNSLVSIVKAMAQIPWGEWKPELSKSPGTLEMKACHWSLPCCDTWGYTSLQGVLSQVQHLQDITVLNPSISLLNPFPALGMLARELALLLGLYRHARGAKMSLNGMWSKLPAAKPRPRGSSDRSTWSKLQL